MAEEIQSVTSSEWKLVHRRLDDLENLVTDMKLKLETLGECKCNRRNSYLETLHSDDEETEMVIGLTLNSQSDLVSAASEILGISGQSTTNSEEILTSVERYAGNTADSTSTAGTGSNLDDSASASPDGIPVSTKSILRLSNGIGIQNLERYRRAQVKLTRCDQVEVAGTSSSSEFRIAKKKPTNKESRISSKKRLAAVLQRGRGAQVSAPHSPHEKRFVCHFCSKRFGVKSILTEHVRIHTGDKPFQCNICSKTFTQTAHLKSHRIIHSGEKPFECGFCSKKFTQSSSLGIHRRVHTGERPYECGFCSKKFKHSHALVVHLRSHTGERPYICQLCSKAFAAPSSLWMHLRVHTREKPYSCPFCPKIFAHSNSLKLHLKKHPG